eukprot:EG_transcript_26027
MATPVSAWAGRGFGAGIGYHPQHLGCTYWTPTHTKTQKTYEEVMEGIAVSRSLTTISGSRTLHWGIGKEKRTWVGRFHCSGANGLSKKGVKLFGMPCVGGVRVRVSHTTVVMAHLVMLGRGMGRSGVDLQRQKVGGVDLLWQETLQ